MKPEVICYMMSSVNGRIDCAMTELIDGSDEYYDILNDLHFDATIVGKTTAVMHYAKDNKYLCAKAEKAAIASFYKAGKYSNYTIIMDTYGTLTWDTNELDHTGLVIALSEQVNKEYLEYLKKMNISYIVTGKDKINLNQLLEILYKEFNIKKLGVVGGGKANGAFLKEKLINELHLLIGPGIDARSSQPNLFDGFNENESPINLKLKSCKVYDDGGVYLIYSVK